MSDQELIDVATTRMDALNSRDWDTMRAICAVDLVYHEVATGRQPGNVDQMIELYKGWASAFPDAHATIHNTYVGDNTVVLESTLAGIHTGTLVTPNGEIPATHKPLSVRSCQLCEIEDGKVTKIHHYFDMMLVMQQLGVTG